MKPIQLAHPAGFIGAPTRRFGPGPGLPVETAYFKTAFTLHSPARLRLQICASSRYALYVNGQEAAHGPCKGDRFQYYCDSLQLDEYLKTGVNVLAVKVVSFPPPEGVAGYENMGPFSIIGTASGPCLLAEGECLSEEGRVNLTTGEAQWFVKNDDAVTWVANAHTMVFCHEQVDAARLPEGWTTSEEMGQGFVPAVLRWKHKMGGSGEIPPIPLYERPIPMLFETKREFLRECAVPVEGAAPFHFWEGGAAGPVTLPPEGCYAVDLDAGELTTGYFYLRAAGGKGAKITLTYSECYGGPLSGSPQKGVRDDWENHTLDGFTDSYLPDGRDMIYEPFWFRTFRFVRVLVKTGGEPVTLFPPYYRETGYPLAVKTQPVPQQEWVQKLWDISLRTLRRCMHETYEDCPYYEQMQYALDTRLQILFTYALSGDTRMAERTVNDFHVSMLPEGILLSRSPSNIPQIIPTFSLFWISMLLDFYIQTGSPALMEQYRFTMESVLHWFQCRKNADGLVAGLPYWEFIDWPPQWDDTFGVPHAAVHGASTIQNLLYVYGLMQGAQIMDTLGYTQNAGFYREEAKQIQETLLRLCYNKEKGLFREGPGFEEYTQHAQVWAVLTDTVCGQEASALMERMLADKSLIRCTYPIQFYLFRALEKVGLYERTEAVWDDWKMLLDLHLTTISEKPEASRSDCHAWGALLLYEYPVKILGVYPREAGYQVIGIKPHGRYLGSAKGSVHTPAGQVDVEWWVRDGLFTLQGTAPAGRPTVITLPDETERTIPGGSFCYTLPL